MRRKKLLRKVDLRLLPTLALIYLMSYLDKNALAQAKLSGLEDDLNMHGTQFNTATSIYFIGYLLFQFVSNMLLTRLRPSIYLPLAAVLWGVVAAAQSATQTYGGLVAARFFLGVAESPVFPGCLFLMSSWYTRSELAHRFAWFFSGNQLASAFGGLISAGILANLDGSLGLSAWRWLFIILGVVTVFVGICAIFILPNYPSNTRWLSEDERAYAQWRLIADTGNDDLPGSISAWAGLRLMLKDKRVYVFLLLQHCGNLVQTFMFFFPAIVKTLGYPATTTLLITAPVWFLAFLVSLLATYTAGRFGNRTYHIVVLMSIACIGNIMMISTTKVPVRFVAMFLLPMGASACFQIIVTFVASSFPRPFEKRAQVVAWGSTMGNLASIYGSYMYPNPDAPRYLAGGAATASVCVLVASLAMGIRFWLKKLNRELEEKEIAEIHGEESTADPVGFRYVL